MKKGSNAQKGFTLIEVSLAIVIGVIVLAGAITLYNQSKVSAGNSKAQEKSLALAAVVEELAAANNMAYPSVGNVNTAWRTRREDADMNPWGGTLAVGAAPNQKAVKNAGDATNAGPYSWPTSTMNAWSSTAANVASAGFAVYATGTGTSSVYDAGVVATKTYANYFVGIVNPAGEGAAFTAGGK